MKSAVLLLGAALSLCGAGKPALYLIGDSTVRNGSGTGDHGQWGWGEPLAEKFDATRITVLNRALGGTSTRTFYRDRWAAVRDLLQPGDFVILQFGHNDGGPLDDKSRARGTIRGTGDELQEIDNPITGKHEVVHSYGWYLRRFIAETKDKGATPIVCSLIPRMIWADGKISRDASTYAGWARDIANREGTAFLDLNERIALRYDALGPEQVKPLFADEHTHTTRAGAELNAAIVIEALRAVEGDPLGAYLLPSDPP